MDQRNGYSQRPPSPAYVSISENSAHPIVGGDGTVYVGLGKNIYALDPANGAPLWTYATTGFIQSSPLIGPVTGGKALLYVPSRDQNLYEIWRLGVADLDAYNLLDGRCNRASPP